MQCKNVNKPLSVVKIDMLLKVVKQLQPLRHLSKKSHGSK